MTLRVYYGGTFDPVHNGHLAVARTVRDVVGTTVWLLPATDPPHRAVPGATGEDRAAMLELAVAGQPGLRVDRRELVRGIPSRTIDTIEELRAQYGAAAPLAFLVGADSFIGLPTWKAFPALLDAAHWIVAERPGHPLDEYLPPEVARAAAGRWTLDAGALHAAPGGKVLRVRQTDHPESATQVRRRIGAGETWHHLVPLPVARYIEQHGLYGAQPRPAPGAGAGL